MPPEQLAEISKMLNQVKGQPQTGGQAQKMTNSEEEQMLQIFNLLKFMQRYEDKKEKEKHKIIIHLGQKN